MVISYFEDIMANMPKVYEALSYYCKRPEATIAKEHLRPQGLLRRRSVSACLRTYGTHALKEASVQE